MGRKRACDAGFSHKFHETDAIQTNDAVILLVRRCFKYQQSDNALNGKPRMGSVTQLKRHHENNVNFNLMKFK